MNDATHRTASDPIDLIGTIEAGRMLNIKRRAVVRLVRQGYLAAYRIPGSHQLRVPRQAVLDLLAAVRVGTGG